jgi:hypothetical protein
MVGMHAVRRPTLSLLLAGGMIAAGLAISPSPGHAAGGTSLAVSPGKGSPDTAFTVTYRWPSARGRKHTTTCAPSQITFHWDRSVLGTVTSTLTGDSCVAALRATPPAEGADAGTHTITVTSDASARATYVVTGDPTGTPIPGASDPGPVIDPQTPDAQPTDAASPAGLTAPRQGGGGDGMIGVLSTFGVILLLAGAGILVFILLRTRRPQPGAEARWSSETQTQAFAVPNRESWRAAHRARRRFRWR